MMDAYITRDSGHVSPLPTSARTAQNFLQSAVGITRIRQRTRPAHYTPARSPKATAAHAAPTGRFLFGTGRLGVEELLQQRRHGLGVFLSRCSFQLRHEAVPGQRAVDAGQ